MIMVVDEIVGMGMICTFSWRHELPLSLWAWTTKLCIAKRMELSDEAFWIHDKTIEMSPLTISTEEGLDTVIDRRPTQYGQSPATVNYVMLRQ